MVLYVSWKKGCGRTQARTSRGSKNQNASPSKQGAKFFCLFCSFSVVSKPL